MADDMGYGSYSDSTSVSSATAGGRQGNNSSGGIGGFSPWLNTLANNNPWAIVAIVAMFLLVLLFVPWSFARRRRR